jgi:glycosyl hydrolase family 38
MKAASYFASLAGSSLVFCRVLAAGDTPPASPGHVKQLDLIHFSHTDYGFTDHPAVCRDMQRRYLDIALDTAIATRNFPPDAQFHWTAETTVAVNDWWLSTAPARRKRFLQALRAGQLEVTALPFNNTPFLNRDQWNVMTHWLPEDLWKTLRPQTAVQNDVNGFPRAGARALLDRGVHYLFSGINSDSGGPPLPRLTAFWWKQPDGRRLFVWMSLSYGDGFFLFESQEWRRGPLPLAADARFRPPRAGDILKTDEVSLRQAHEQCVKRLRQFERDGYRYPVLAVSMTSMWRYDNDPPFPPLSDFVAAWNKLGLQPRLKLTTVTQAMKDLEQAAGPTAPVYEGEWTDWWANGTMCAPREVAASRFAKRYLAASQSPVWGPLDAAGHSRIEELSKDLCLFDEHTWGSGMSVGQPYSLDAQGQWNEKARLAWRPMALSEWLLGQRARTRLVQEGEGLWLANPTRAPFSGWATMIASCLREDYRSLIDPASGARLNLHFESGPLWGRPQKPEDLSREDVSSTFPDKVPNRFARFWVENLDANSVKRFQLCKDSVDDHVPAAGSDSAPVVRVDDQGWPVAATWPGMSKSLFTEGLGDFVSIKVNAFAPRWTLQDIWHTADPSKRQQLTKEKLEFITASAAGKTAIEETPHTFRYVQALEHPRLKWATRRLEIWKRQPRARLTFRLNRISSFDPELLCIVNPVPCDGTLPRLSSGGMGFTPFTDQFPGTCRDYFAIDGLAHYATPEGNWLWVTRDAPLVTFDGPHPKSHLTSPPARTGRVLAIVYDNFWYTNFQGDSPGVMEFQFDLIWRARVSSEDEAGALADALVCEPVMVINPSMPEHPLFIQDLYRP